ncbi:MAG: Ham1 family protein [Chthoniobacteraceae bacterium]|nr:Ham1 family protein [Chthoniobacteraceae bacterium]
MIGSATALHAHSLNTHSANFFPIKTALLIATHNSHKTGEIQAMLGERFLVSDLNAHPELPVPEETGATFEENAIIKATAAARVFEWLVLSDDSGLEVDALDGAPGVRSARYAGEQANDAENRARLLSDLDSAAARGKQRSARFRCVMALFENNRLLGTFNGAVEGVIINQERGSGGFGYDSLFVPAGYCETFGQLPAEEKNQLSHRARALEQVKAFLQNAGYLK